MMQRRTLAAGVAAFSALWLAAPLATAAVETPDALVKRLSADILETIKMMVSIGLAWSVLPRTMLDDQVVRLPLPGIQLQRRLGYILHRERTLSNAARAFMALLDSHAGSA